MFWTAFILGLAGSLHCAGMCSPLVFAVTYRSKKAFLNRVIYNTGRILTYGFLGALVSSMGVVLPLEKFQNGLSIGMGVLLIMAGVIGTSNFPLRILNRAVQKFTSSIKGLYGNQVQKKTLASYLLLGALNGLLPCGLTFIALTSTIISPTPLDGFYFMVLFGLGTLPMMLGLLTVTQLVTQRFKFNISKVTLVLLILAGGLLIGRGAFIQHSTPGVHHNQVVVCP